jgi:hypothetical protein
MYNFFLYLKEKDYMKNTVRKIIRESVSKMFENKNIWDRHGDNLPSIFKGTIYRLPTKKELEEVNNFNLNADEISQGFNYTIVGRGMFSDKNKEMIVNSIKALCDLYPNNKEYKEALKKEESRTPRLHALNENEDRFWQDMKDKINTIQTCEEMYNYVFEMSCGFHFPFNPPDPLRSLLRNKMEELKQIDLGGFSKIEWMYNKVSGEYVPTPELPPGAVY